MDLPITISISATTVAWWGALISTFLAVLKIFEYQRERVSVNIEARSNYWYITGDEFVENEKYIVVIIRNKGRRPITIQNVAGITKGKTEMNFIVNDVNRKGPKEITEGKSTMYLIPEKEIDPKTIKHFLIFDEAGRKFKGNLKSK